MIRKYAFVAASVLALSAAPALADPITLDAGDVGTSFTLNYNGFADGAVVDGLTASTSFTLKSVTDTSYSFDYTVANTTSGDLSSRVSSFAFDTNPDISSATSTGTYNYTVLDSNYPNGIGNVDVCFKGGASNSCAGNSGGVTTGDPGTGSLTLNFSDPISALTLDNFFVRYQSITGAGNITSASGAVTSSSGGTPVPEPGMLVLFGIGAAAVAFGRRRKAAPARALQPSFA
ncbi:cistern family PEP-CTERM protein [Altererythrobacter sp. TH136]|uniref:cistern family PEP-CTERM protein n=1 Tax=Altererythrobacter sp. TH136 TaxID=2067415 RepID=UPI001165ACF2|nr:cistern family PEP-CTERM protein [Altererythrobacter sp. TH136]QDM40776.1 PEP-CTERM sorting domain-containing protein [Altererythrobacter sp. TH136]